MNRFWVWLVSLLTIVDIAYSADRVTPDQLCHDLARPGLVRDCRPGAPWAFETTRYRARVTFDPTGDPYFHCYQGPRHGVAHRDCRFRGVLLQFATDADVVGALAQIRAQNGHTHTRLDLEAEVVRADTTLEQYALYGLPRDRIIAIVPIGPDVDRIRSALEGSGEVVDL